MKKQTLPKQNSEHQRLPEREANEAIHAGLTEPAQGLSKDLEALRKDLREANF